MFKSLGIVIDPCEVINEISLESLHKRIGEGNLDPKEPTVSECGADALRFALISYTAQVHFRTHLSFTHLAVSFNWFTDICNYFVFQSDKINLDIQRVVGYHQWCNKLWNVVWFSISRLGDDYVPPTNVNPNDLPFSYQWILSILNKATSKKIMDLESYEFSDVASTMHSWWQYRVIFVLKQLSLSLLGVIKSLSLRRVLLRTHFGYILAIGCDCFILLCHML